MNENEIKIAERFNILDKCQKLEKDFLQLSRITKVEFDLNGLYDNIYQVIILVKYEIPYDEEEFYNEFGIHFDDLGND